jgi:tetratricopeptide (TPR) repeat protein
MRNKDQTAFLLALKRNIKLSLHNRNLEAAREGLEALKQHDLLGLETRGLELEYLIDVGHFQDAASLAAQLVNLFPGSSRIQFLAGRLAYRQKDYARALPFFEESYRLHPSWRSEWFIGKTQTQAGNFEAAEPLFLRLVGEHPACLKDLAWLYERKSEFARAEAVVNQYLRHFPRDTLARQQLQRLQAHALPAADILDEVETLSSFDEDIPVALLTEYVETRLTGGEGDALRKWLLPRIEKMDDRVAQSVGWACHRLNAFDLSFELLLKNFLAHSGNFKYLGALESSAEKSGQMERLIELYERHADDDKRFYGRVKRLTRRLE